EFGRQALAQGDEFHFGRHVAASRVVQLRGRRPIDRATNAHAPATVDDFGIAATIDPRLPKRGKALLEVVMPRSARVVHLQRRFPARNGDLANRPAHTARSFEKHLARTRESPRRNPRQLTADRAREPSRGEYSRYDGYVGYVGCVSRNERGFALPA